MINVQVIGFSEQIKPLIEDKEIRVSYPEDEVQALNTTEKTKPSVILLNYKLRKAETDNYIKLLLAVSQESKIIVVADGLDEKNILLCLMAGARGYQNENRLNDYVVKMIKVVNAGEAWITRRLVTTLLNVLMHKQQTSSDEENDNDG